MSFALPEHVTDHDVIRVLLVEDNDGDARLVELMLQSTFGAAIQLSRARSLAEALQQIDKATPDCVILDLGLPDAHGLEAIRRIKARAPLMAVVVLTGDDDGELGTQAVAAGAQDYLVKGNTIDQTLTRSIRYAVLRKSGEDALFRSRQALADAQHIARLGSWELDLATDTMTWSDELCRLYGYPTAPAPGLEAFFTRLHPDDKGTAEEVLRAALATRTPFDLDHRIVLPSERVRWVRSQGRVESLGSETPLWMRGTAQDITKQKSAEQALNQQALHDPLTMLPNRTLLLDRLRQAQARLVRHPSTIGVLFVDIDRFKVLNDSLGHSVGDQVLIAMAERLQKALRPTDTLARFGGDEFVILCEDLSGERDAMEIAARIAASVAEPLKWGGGELIMSVSTGIATTGSAFTSAEDLLRDADTAMYRAKEEGRARSVVFAQPMRDQAVGRLDAELSLRVAITEHQLEVHYQPILDLPTGMIVGTEALVRWRHPDRGLIPPDEFIPIAEETGLIVPLGAWVLRQAALQTKSWQRRPGCSGLNIAVNLSAVQLRQPDFVDMVAQVLRDTGLSPSSLELEMTESVLMDNATQSERILDSLKALGVRLSVDDFGTGYSSLSYLKRFPVDSVKIARSFVDGLGGNAADTAIVDAIISMASALNLYTIGEGVETPLQLQELRGLGCAYAQGYLFARPMAAADLLPLLDDRTGLAPPNQRTKDEADARASSPGPLSTAASSRRRRSSPATVTTLPRPSDGDDGQESGDLARLHSLVDELRGDLVRMEKERRALEEDRSELQRFVDAMPQIVWKTRPDGWNTYFNRQWMDFTGLTLEESMGYGWNSPFHPEDQQRAAALWEQSTSSGVPFEIEYRLRRADGTYHWMLGRATPLLDAAGNVVTWYGSCTNIEELKQAQERVDEQARLLDLAQDAILVEDLEHRVVYWNHGAERIYGWSSHEAVGRHLAELIATDRSQVAAARAVLHEQGEWDGELRGVDKAGAERLVESRWTLVRNADGSPKGVLWVNTDVTDRRATEASFLQMLETEATHDPLTGIPNRALLDDRLKKAVASCQRNGTPLAVLFLDLDAFKDINDGSGHLLGDTVLVEVGTRIESVLRDGDTAARFGGDEFVVVLPNADEAAADVIAHRLLAAVREPMEVDGHRLHVSASIGLAVSPPVEPDALLRCADAAVYHAKSRGRAQVQAFVGELAARAEERFHLSSDLQDALDRDQLTLAYQPIVDLASGGVLGFEALARWQHPARGAVPPNLFVTLAEETGQARELDAWVLRRACAEMAGLRSTGAVPDGTYLSVNITAPSVTDQAIPDVVVQALSAAHLPPSALVIEVTETGVMADVDAGIRTLTALRALGVRVAIDDFGTGWSSITYLKRLPASILKLDRSFVARLHEDEEDLAIAASVIELGRATGMTVVAEGVETMEQLDTLRQLSCTAAQGYLWHHPVPAADVARAVRKCASLAPRGAR